MRVHPVAEHTVIKSNKNTIKMRKYLYPLCIFFAAALLFCGCEKEEPYEEPPPVDYRNGEGTLTVDGISYKLNYYKLQRFSENESSKWLMLNIRYLDTETRFSCSFWDPLDGYGAPYTLARYNNEMTAGHFFGWFYDRDGNEDKITSGTMNMYKTKVDGENYVVISVEASSAAHSYKLEFYKKGDALVSTQHPY